jgi:hypothetical protein
MLEGAVSRHRLSLVLIYAGLLAAGWLAGKLLLDLVHINVAAESPDRVLAFVVLATAAFIVASAVPFVPGLEIGIGLMLIFGAKMAPLVYASLVAALTVSFLVGRFVAPERVAAAFGKVGLGRARELVLQLTPLDATERIDFLTARAPRRLVPLLLRYRYAALVVLFNLPGNSVIGGGGGIAFTAGISGLYTLPGYLAALVIAAIPIPLIILVSKHFV